MLNSNAVNLKFHLIRNFGKIFATNLSFYCNKLLCVGRASRSIACHFGGNEVTMCTTANGYEHTPSLHTCISHAPDM